jgi:hypothetical protein
MRVDAYTGPFHCTYLCMYYFLIMSHVQHMLQVVNGAVCLSHQNIPVAWWMVHTHNTKGLKGYQYYDSDMARDDIPAPFIHAMTSLSLFACVRLTLCFRFEWELVTTI